MKITQLALLCAAAVAGAGALLTASTVLESSASAQLSSNASVFVTGLAGPRGLKFGPDGLLYVAEAGFGGTTSTKGQCAQVVPPIGPYVGGYSGLISSFDKNGKRQLVASGFPSAVSADATKDTSSVADVAFMDGELYAVLAGGGCSHGNTAVPNGIVKVNIETHNWKLVANLSDFIKSHPAKYENAGDFEPDGVFYSLIAHRDRLYTVEPNHGQVFSITAGGEIREEIDISEAEGHIVPTSIVERDGTFYVGNLGLFPITPSASKILTLDRNWHEQGGAPGLDAGLKRLKVAGSRAGFATIVGVDFGPDGLLYALELSPAVGYPTPGAGKVVRLNADGSIEDIATGLSVPTGMAFGPDGDLYVSNFGAAPAGAGQIIRIKLP